MNQPSDTDKLMETLQPSKPLSIRRMYLTRRAHVIRQALQGYGSDIGGFIQEVNSAPFNATKDEICFAEGLRWMQENLHTEANIADLARIFNVSVRKIQRLFAFFARQSYTSVLLDMRIEASKQYLREMKNTIGEVAYLVGVKDHAYFTFLFRKSTGMTPSDYRLSFMKSQNEAPPPA